jgi:hypothetical protein
MTLQCARTPAMDAAYAAKPAASPQALTALCHKCSHPVAASATVRHRRYKAHSAATPLCRNAGCAYIWLFNDANGFGEAEYEAAAYYPLLGARQPSRAIPRRTTVFPAGPTP